MRERAITPPAPGDRVRVARSPLRTSHLRYDLPFLAEMRAVRGAHLDQHHYRRLLRLLLHPRVRTGDAI
jgi:hypothetical protein